MTYAEQILALQSQMSDLPLVRSGYEMAKTAAAGIAAQADARILQLEGEVVFRKAAWLGSDSHVQELQKELENLRRENNVLNATLVTAREEGKL